jgi:hypothetical protein
MSTTYLGTSPLKVSSEVVFDPKYGFTTRETYSGTQSTLSTLNATLILLGVRTSITQEGGRTFLNAFYALQDASGNTPETPNDYYELETEYVQESVWKNDIVESKAAALVAAGETAGDVLARWRRVIEAGMKGMRFSGVISADGDPEFEKVTDGPLNPSSLTANLETDGLALYNLFLRDGDAYETTRQVLSRVRTISVAYSAQTVAQARPIIYTTSQLISVFGIPATIAARLPADPTEIPSGTLWSWKQRRNTSRYEWSGRVAEVMSWTFAAWSTVTHQLYGA